MTLDIGRLLRLKNMVDTAATSVEPNAGSARALTDSYVRLREEVREMIADSELKHEFHRVFPGIAIQEAPNPSLAGGLALEDDARLNAEAQRARALLGQLAGWVQGLIDEQTLEKRLQLEAEAKARKTGF